MESKKDGTFLNAGTITVLNFASYFPVIRITLDALLYFSH